MVLTAKEIENILKKYLKDVPEADIRKAAQALKDSAGDWHEIDLTESLGAVLSVQCKDICGMGEAFQKGYKIRAYISEKK